MVKKDGDKIVVKVGELLIFPVLRHTLAYLKLNE